MLILTRYVGEKIVIDHGDKDVITLANKNEQNQQSEKQQTAEDKIEVTILSVNRHKVSIGINAPGHIAVHREEIYKRILANKALHESKT